MHDAPTPTAERWEADLPDAGRPFQSDIPGLAEDAALHRLLTVDCKQPLAVQIVGNRCVINGALVNGSPVTVERALENAGLTNIVRGAERTDRDEPAQALVA